MNKENVTIIKKFGEYNDWVIKLKYIPSTLWNTPVSTKKWSAAEIVSHLTNWDHYLLNHIIPSVKMGRGMEFPDFDSYNKKASEYVKSGVTQEDLIEEAINARNSLVNALLQISEMELCQPLTSNGVSHCPHTGEPYSLLYIIQEFIQHDQHHKNQIMSYLSKNSLK